MNEFLAISSIYIVVPLGVAILLTASSSPYFIYIFAVALKALIARYFAKLYFIPSLTAAGG